MKKPSYDLQRVVKLGPFDLVGIIHSQLERGDKKPEEVRFHDFTLEIMKSCKDFEILIFMWQEKPYLIKYNGHLK